MSAVLICFAEGRVSAFNLVATSVAAMESSSVSMGIPALAGGVVVTASRNGMGAHPYARPGGAQLVPVEDPLGFDRHSHFPVRIASSTSVSSQLTARRAQSMSFIDHLSGGLRELPLRCEAQPELSHRLGESVLTAAHPNL